LWSEHFFFAPHRCELALLFFSSGERKEQSHLYGISLWYKIESKKLKPKSGFSLNGFNFE